MWNKRRVVVASVTAFLLLAAGAAGACLTRTAVQGYITAVETIDVGDEWMDEAGVMHGRGGQSEETPEGDLDGTLYVRANYELDLNPFSANFGDGKMWGTLKFVGSHGTSEGTYVGVWGGPIEDFYLDVDWFMFGFGGFARTWLKVDNYGPMTPPGMPFIPQVYDGYVISK